MFARRQAIPWRTLFGDRRVMADGGQHAVTSITVANACMMLNAVVVGFPSLKNCMEVYGGIPATAADAPGSF